MTCSTEAEEEVKAKVSKRWNLMESSDEEDQAYNRETANDFCSNGEKTTIARGLCSSTTKDIVGEISADYNEDEEEMVKPGRHSTSWNRISSSSDEEENAHEGKKKEEEKEHTDGEECFHEEGASEDRNITFSDGFFPVEKARIQVSLKTLQMKVRQAKEKQEQQKGNETPPHPPKNSEVTTETSRKGARSSKSSVYQELTGKDRIRFARNRSEELLQAAVSSESNFEDTRLERTAKALEAAIFSRHSSGGSSYTRKVRDIVANVKRNHELRRDLLTGKMTEEQVASMSLLELASSEVKKRRDEEAREGLEERIGREGKGCDLSLSLSVPPSSSS